MNARRLLVLVIVSLLIAACGGAPGGGASNPASGTAASGSQGAPATTQAQSGAAAGGEIQMRMAWWGSKDRHDRTIKVIDLSQKENPNVKITYEFSAFDDYWTKLTT